MDNQVITEISSVDVARALGLDHVGLERSIRFIRPLSTAIDASLCFAKAGLKFAENLDFTVITQNAESAGRASVIISKNPRLDFARALAWIEAQRGFSRPHQAPEIHPTARIGNGVVLANGVRIGANTIIHHNTVIGEGVIVGERCVIKSCAVVGEDGFGFERDEDGLPVRLVHLGTVVIGNDVEIGSLTTVCRGTLGDTIIEDFAKIDDHVHIAHNVIVRKGAMVIACAEVSGGVEVGEFSWIGPNAAVIQQVKIGAHSIVGIGANVLRDVAEGTTVAGNPAKPLVRSA